MDFDYYQIKGKWIAANVTRRAEKLEEAGAPIYYEISKLKETIKRCV